MTEDSNTLTLLLLIPALAAFLLGLLPASSRKMLFGVALAVTVLTFLISLRLFLGFDNAAAGMQFVEKMDWFRLGQFQAQYHVGIDGISLFLVLLTTLIMPLAILASWSIEKHLKPYLAFMLLLEVGMLGVFIALDLVLFYLFWEVMLIPMYFIIGIWGGENRIYAAVKFFLYTFAGSIFMLVAIISLYFLSGGTSFDLVEITRRLTSGEMVLSPGVEALMFIAFFVAFAVKVPLFPFHTWLPDAHVEAPTAGSVILAGVLLKMGTYGLLRFCLPLFPAASVQMAPIICLLAIVGIIYGALVAMVQPDIKKLVAYSSVSHLGFVVLGIFAFNVPAIKGATLQMLNHGLSTGALFLLVGMIYDRRHTREISQFGGLTHVMPRFAAIFMFITLSSIGLPGLNGFVGEFLILQGTFLEHIGYAVFAALAILLSAVYMLWMYQRVFLGKLTNPANRALRDLCPRETGLLIPIMVLCLWMGMYSQSFLAPMHTSVQQVVDRIEQIREIQTYRVEHLGH